MAVVQTTYNEDVAIAYPGMAATQEIRNRISRTITDVAGIGFGKAAYRAAGSDKAITGTPAAGALEGITLSHYAVPPNPTSGVASDSYIQYASVPLQTDGAIWVTNGAATVARGDQVYVTPAGAFTNVSTGNVIATGWFFDMAAAAASLVRIARR